MAAAIPGGGAGGGAPLAGGGVPPLPDGQADPALAEQEALFVKIQFWKQKLETGAIDQAAYAAALKVLQPPQVIPPTPSVAVLRAEDSTTTKNDIIDNTVKEWYGSVETGLKIESEAWNVFSLNGRDPNQRAEVENHRKASNLNVQLTSCFDKSGGKTLAWLAPKDKNDEHDVMKSYVANQAVLYYIADLAAISISWWLFSEPSDRKKRDEARIVTKNSLIKEQNDQAKITKLRTYMLNQQKKTGGIDDSEKVPCPTCGKKHLGVCWRQPEAPPRKKARTERAPKTRDTPKKTHSGKKKKP